MLVGDRVTLPRTERVFESRQVIFGMGNPSSGLDEKVYDSPGKALAEEKKDEVGLDICSTQAWLLWEQKVVRRYELPPCFQAVRTSP